MQVKEINSEGLKRSYQIVINATDIEEKVSAKLKDLSSQANLPGFRPGKVPTKILRSRFGKSVFGEVIQQTIDETTKQTLKDKEIKPALQPKIEVAEGFEEGKDLEFSLSIEIIPEIKNVDFKGIKFQKDVYSPDKEEIQDSLNKLAEQQKTFESLKEGSESALNNAVIIDFTGKIDGEIFEGGTAKDHQLELGSGQFIPGFEDQLIGVKTGDKKDVIVTFPDNYQNESLKGKEAIFEVEVKDVKESVIPIVNDDFAKTMGLKDLSDLKNKVEEQIQKEYENVSRSKLKKNILDKLEELSSFDLPPTLVDNEFSSIWQQIEKDKKEDKLGPEDKDKSDEQLKEEYLKIAQRRVKLGLLLSNIGEKNDIKVEQSEVNRAIQSQAMRFPGQEKQVFEFYKNNPEASMQIQAPLFEDKVVDYLIELSEISDNKVSKEELLNDNDSKVNENSRKKPSQKKSISKKTTAKKKVVKKPATKKIVSSKKSSPKKISKKKSEVKKK
ncbi:trigger factor [Alphaproteobacteria bacterium]|nr:trigger factor [Alphaproteobacteria bacterium]